MPLKAKSVRKVNEKTKAELVELLMERIQPHLKAHVENWLNFQLLKMADYQPDSNPFAIRYSDFIKLSKDEARKLQEKIYMENYDWIESELARRKAEWMIVVNGQVIKSSRTFR